MLEDYLDQIQEGYIFSDKTISVNFDAFLKGTKKKLLIFGVAGSGKTTLGERLAKKFRVKWISIDSLYWRLKQKYFKNVKEKKEDLEKKVLEEVIKYLKSNERLIMEGTDIIRLYDEYSKYRKLIINQSMIILGLSSIKAGLRAGRRNMGREGGEGWRELYWMPKWNIKLVEPALKTMRRDVMKLPNIDIKEYRI